MKRTIKNIISCVVFAVALVFAILGCADLLEYKEGRQKYTPFFESQTNFDVVFLGSSHMWNSMLPMELWKEYGISSYNWGYSNCTPAETYYLIPEILKYTDPEVLVMDLYGLIEYEQFGNGKYRTDRIEQQHVQFDEIPLSANKIAASRDLFDDYPDNADFLWNFAMYHNRWTELGQTDFAYEYNTEKGAYFMTGLDRNKFKPVENAAPYEPDTVCYSYFLQILEYCEANGISLVCTYVPFDADETVQRIAQSIGTVIESYEGCHYVDMLYQDIVDFSTDMYNNGHLNYSGACKATSWMGQYLSAHYQLDDYSQDASWQADYEDYLAYKIQNLEAQSKLVNHLLLLYGDDFRCQLEIYDETLPQSAAFNQLVRNVSVEAIHDYRENDACARLTVVNARTGQEVFQRSFTYDASKTFNIQNIVLAQ